MEKISGEIFEVFKQLPHIGDVTSRILYNEGFRTIREIAEVDPEELSKILEIEKEKAVEIIERAAEGKEKEGAESKKEEVRPPSDSALDSVDRIDGVGERTADILRANGFQTIQDLLKADGERLSSLPGIGPKKAEKLLQSAQRLVEEGKK